MIRRIVIFLIRKKLKLKTYECFKFSNQKSNAIYYFTKTELVKCKGAFRKYPSGCSLNWLLDNNCEIEKLGIDETWA